MNQFPISRVYLLLILGLPWACLGCGKTPQITTYEVPPVAAVAPQTPATMSRTLAAAFRQADQVWFFKMTGSESRVAGQANPFQQWVDSVQFNNNQPVWTLPTGWTQSPGGGMRFATVSTPDGLEATVIALPTDKYDELQNVNRWRGQLGLPPLIPSELDPNITRKEVHGVPVVWVDIKGVANSNAGMSGGMAPPFAGGNANNPLPGPGPAEPTAPPTTATDSQPTEPNPAQVAPATVPSADPADGNLPAHWKPGKMSAMRKAAYEVMDGEQKAEITVIVLSAQSGSLEDNVNRWRGQLGLPNEEPAAILAAVQKIQVGGKEGSYIELFGSDAANAPSMLAAFAKTDEQTWYFKLTAPKSLAERERDHFRKFVTQYSIP